VINFSSLGLQAISDAQPAGNDVRDEADFDLLQNEIAKMSNPVTSGTLDWQQVVQLSATLLSDKGKDILVACYLAGGLLQTRGLPGLLDGVQVLNDMLQTYWDTLYPPLQRLRGRRNALQWLIERIKLHGDETDWSALAPQEPALVEGLREALKAIDALLVDKDSDAPSLRPAISQVNTIPVREIVPEPVDGDKDGDINADSPSAQQTASSSAASAAAGAAAAATIIALDSAEHVEQASTAALEKLGDIADWLSDAELNKPLAFRLKRIAVWATIENLPLLRGGQTLLPGPIPQIQDVLRNLLNSQSNEDLIRFAEAQLTLFPFWLDLNCIAAQAMERLGASFDAARHEVCGETTRLLGRLPGLEQMAFVSGMPFANAETLQWLQALNTAANDRGGADGTDGMSGTGARSDSLQTALAGARALAAENDVAGAAAGLQKAIDQTSAPRSKLQLRIHLCELLFAQRPGANLDAFARALIAEIDRFELQTWDPPLALSGLQAAYNIVARNDEAKSETDALLARIVALDASAAVKLVT